MQKIKPFLKYVGGKRWTYKIENLFPKNINDYHEPFLGSGSIYFYLKANNIINGNSYLSDLNPDLIDTFNSVKNNLTEVTSMLQTIDHTIENYNLYAKSKFEDETKIAIRYIFLNRYSYGGMYRVNKRGQFNVPYGNRSYKEKFDFKGIEFCSNLLNSNTFISKCDFKFSEFNLMQNDFICLDPPYTGKIKVFDRYNNTKFGNLDEEKIIQIVKKTTNENAKFLLFAGDNQELAEKIGNMGDILYLDRMNNLGNKLNQKVEIIVKNY